MPALPQTIDITSHIALACLMLWLIRSLRRWPWVFALITLPGTLAHELLHFGVGLLTGARPISLSIFPAKQQDGSWVLGEVRFARLRWWNRIPVGLAPLALLPLGLWLLGEAILRPLWSWENAGLTSLTVQCVNAGWPSQRDWAHAVLGMLALGLLGILLFVLFWLGARAS
jgi:hypothetical protein